MKNSTQVSVSILCADFSSLAEEVRKIEESGADMIHVDIMDGHFVPPVTIGPMIVKALRPLTKLSIDAHLMVEYPETLLESLAEAGTDSVSVHAECFGELKEDCRGFGEFPKEIVSLDVSRAKQAVDKIRQLGMKAFMTVNPGTDIGLLDPVLPDLDGVLIMSVNPGFSHQKFIPGALAKVEHVRRHFDGRIAIDGGVNDLTGAQAVKAGADILATASYFFGAEDSRQCVKGLKSSRM